MNFAAVIFVVVGKGDIIDAQAFALCLVVCNNPGLVFGDIQVFEWLAFNPASVVIIQAATSISMTYCNCDGFPSNSFKSVGVSITSNSIPQCGQNFINPSNVSPQQSHSYFGSAVSSFDLFLSLKYICKYDIIVKSAIPITTIAITISGCTCCSHSGYISLNNSMFVDTNIVFINQNK